MSKSIRGEVAYHRGLEAERSVARKYIRSGYEFVAHRERTDAGEIDLIFQRDAEFIFVEVKSSKNHATAAESLSARQVSRILLAGQSFLAKNHSGLEPNMRFDVALVDAAGQVDVLEGAIHA